MMKMIIWVQKLQKNKQSKTVDIYIQLKQLFRINLLPICKCKPVFEMTFAAMYDVAK